MATSGCQVVTRRGQPYTYHTIGDKPTREYWRDRARERYEPHPRPPKYLALPQSTKDRISDLHSVGLSHSKISEATGVSVFTIRRFLKTLE